MFLVFFWDIKKITWKWFLDFLDHAKPMIMQNTGLGIEYQQHFTTELADT